MNTDLYLKTLEPLCEVIIGTSFQLDKRGSDDKDPPERGYPVVCTYTPQSTTCEWCQQTVLQPATKIYSRTPGSKIWEGKCKECKLKKVIVKE